MPLLELLCQRLFTLLQRGVLLLPGFRHQTIAKQLLTLLLLPLALLLQSAERLLQLIEPLLFTRQILLQAAALAFGFRQLRLQLAV